MPAFRLVADGKPLPLGEYTENVPWRPGSFDGLAQPDRVAAEHAAGATIILQALQLHWEPAAVYCRGLEQALGFPVQANAYATPAAARGFAVHHDTHDVFVLQVSGTKRWRIYAPLLELPLSGQRWSPELGDPGPPVDDLTLEPGDTLYLPRGWPHEAVAQESDSLHITVGLHVPTRLDALRAALDECGDDVEFRRSLGPDGELPPPCSTGSPSGCGPRRSRAAHAAGSSTVAARWPTAGSRSCARQPPSARPTASSAAPPSSPTSRARRCASRARRSASRRSRATCSRPSTRRRRRSPPPTYPPLSTRPAGLVLVRRLVRDGFLRVLP